MRGEAAYLVLPARQVLPEKARQLLRELLEERASEYGSFLVIDIRIGALDTSELSIGYDQEAAASIAQRLEEALGRMPSLQQATPVRQYNTITNPVVDRQWLEKTGSLCLHLTLPSVFFSLTAEEKVSGALSQVSSYFFRCVTPGSLPLYASANQFCGEQSGYAGDEVQ